MTPDERLAALDAAGLTIADVHRAAGGATYHHVRYVVLGERRSPRIEQTYATLVGVPVERAFPPKPAAVA
jgi:hypothetical protein